MSITVKLEGIDKLTEAIKKAMVDHPPDRIRKALTRGANVIVDEAKNRAPSSNRPHSYTNAAGQKVTINPGNLKNSIQILPKWNKDPSGVYVAPKTATKGRRRRATDAYYAHWVEYGTAAHNLSYKGKFVSGKGGADHPGSRPRPYMRPAHDTKKNVALNIAMEDIGKMIMDNAKSI